MYIHSSAGILNKKSVPFVKDTFRFLPAILRYTPVSETPSVLGSPAGRVQFNEAYLWGDNLSKSASKRWDRRLKFSQSENKTFIMPNTHGGLARRQEMITAIVQNRGNTLVVDLPRSPFNLYSCLNSIGIMGNPPMVYIADDKNRDPHVRLFSKSVIGQHLISLFSQEDNLLAVNTVAHLVENADPAFQPKLVDKLLSGNYTTARDFVLDYDKMTHDAGPISLSERLCYVNHAVSFHATSSQADVFYK